ncbi:hypothetical protein [Henriciella litoralis]|uniref:hypothetical protein n=1 Tax=Henriciella litoralis TaxID=568102 RepID=UPI00111C7B11|nr:hypothetical protein [Henriciella litoralis]
MIRPICVTLAALACLPMAQSASAQASDTLTAIIQNGATFSTQGFKINVNYAEDGTFSGDAAGSDFSGTYRIEGDQLCTSSSLSSSETCTEYPPGKAPGDTFEVSSPTMGTITVLINSPE